MPQTRKAAQKVQAESMASATTQTEQTAQVEQLTQTEQTTQVERLRPFSMTFAPGNLLWDDKDVPGNVAGITSIAYAAVVMLETVVNDKASEADVAEMKKVLEYIGGSEAVKEFRDKVHKRTGVSESGMSESATSALSNLFNKGR